MTRYRVLVVDDDFYALEALKLLILRDERTRLWGGADSVERALTLLASAEKPGPDVILLDVRFGSDERAGIDALPAIAEAAPEAKILVTSVLRSEEIVRQAIAAGADGYVWKNESGSGIASAVVGVVEGRFVLTPSIAELVLGRAAELQRFAAEVLPEEPGYADLTSGLKKTMYLFCLCGMSVKEIAAELQLSPATISSRIKTAYSVLGASSRQEAFSRLVERRGVEHE